MTTKNTCCEKCAITKAQKKEAKKLFDLDLSGRFCANKSCPCHQEPQEAGSWEERFDARGGEDLCVYPDDDAVYPKDHLFRGGDVPEKWPENQYELDPDKVKSFIQKEITLAERRVEERIAKKAVELAVAIDLKNRRFIDLDDMLRLLQRTEGEGEKV